MGHTGTTMTAKSIAGAFGSAAILVGCGGTVYTSDPQPGDASSDGPGVLMPDAGDGGKDAAKPDAKTDGSGEHDAFEEYVDPGCPDAAAPVFAFECDPLAPPPGGCPELEACYPYVDYPSDPCEAEVYGAYCLPAGSQTQGQPCASPLDCAAGFVCVVSGSGNQCVRVCSLTDPSTCPEGQICEPLDVAGFGGCL